MASFVSSLFSRTPKPVSLRATNNLDMSGAREEGAQGDVGDLVVTGAEQPESPYRTDGSALENTVQTAGGEEELRADQDEKHEPEQELEEVEEGKEAKDDAQSFQQPHSEDEHSDHGGRRKTRQRRNVVHDSASPQEQALESSSSDSSEGEEADWHGESDGGAEVEAEAQDSSRCIFCGEDEEHDPSEDFEECLACASCGDNAHRQCARDAKMLLTEEAPDDWRCPSCVENDIQPAKPEVVAAARRRSSVPKIARDLLPPQKGVIKPGSHSVFNKLILDDDPMDGSRALRKRKASDDNTEAHIADSPSKQKKYQGRDKTITSLSRSKPPILLESDVDPPASPKTRTRLRQPARVMKSLVRVVEDSSEKFIIAFRVRAGMIADLEHEKRKQKRRERDRARRALKAQHEEEVPVMQYQHYPAIPATTFSAPFYSLQDRDVDETKTKPYGGILTEAEADTTRTFPQPADRKKFDDARLKAEEAWRSRMEAAYANENQKSTHKQSGPPSKIKCINFGGYEIDTWHAAPYPEEYSRNRVLYICEFCLKYMNSDYVAWRHKLKCPAKHPPGDEIYRDGSFSFFEVDGRKNPVYCQNLCLLAKLFLGSKTLYYDVEPFLFYVMTENDEYGCHFVGYFSKEKRPSSLNNVSCILVLPIHQRRGFGHFLIEFSYLLTRNEKKTGSPEKPLSDMGLVSYRSYWRLTMCIQLLNQKDDISITDISDRTGMTADDIVCALEGLRALVRDPVTKTYAMRLDYVYFQQYIENHNKKNYTKINPDALIWTPYIMGRDTSLYDNGAGPQIHTMVQRDEEGDLAEPEEGVQLAVQDDLAEFDKNAYLSNTNLQSLEYLQLNGNSQDSNQTPVPYAPMTSRTESFTSPTKSVRSRAGASDSSRKQQLVPIPPTRFEVFPPLPGTTAKRKPGRPFGSYRSARGGRRGTPVRRSLFRENSVSLSGRPSSLRKTRSQLADMETIDGEEEDEANGNENDIHDDDDEDDDDEEEEEDDEEEEEEEERTDGDLDGTQEGAMHSTEYHDDNAGDMVVVGGADDN